MVKAKEIEGLHCEGSAAGEIRLVLGTRLAEMCEQRGSALEWADPEGVHDMRVASRRLRSALRDFNPYLRKRRLAKAAVELKRVADALGVVRDEDVAITALEELQRDAPEEVATGITELVLERRARQGRARAELVNAITEEKLAMLRADFDAALERAIVPRKKKATAAAAPGFRSVGREIILARLEELRELSGCLYRPFDSDALHEMRIASKRLRYAMELFAACYGEELTEHAKEVAELQTSLGELHDCDVWLEGFSRMLREFKKRENGAVSTVAATIVRKRRAAVWLLRHFAKARMKHFGSALVRWHEWEANGFFPQLARSLNARPTAAELLSAALTASDAVAADVEAGEPA